MAATTINITTAKYKKAFEGSFLNSSFPNPVCSFINLLFMMLYLYELFL